MMYSRFIKRLIDIVISFSLIVILAPVYLLIAIYVRIFMGRPILFKQKRIGLMEEVFSLYKFRSMTNKKDRYGNLLPERDRLTKAGIMLRSSSLDELPELFLVLTGKMSFVGPRPLPDYYMPYYKDNERKRHTVRGGLIPPDSLSMNTTPSWEEQFEYDCYYADNVSFVLDVKVVIATLAILFKRVKNNYGAADDRPHLSEYRKNRM